MSEINLNMKNTNAVGRKKSGDDTRAGISQIVEDFVKSGRTVSVRKVQEEFFLRSGTRASNKTIGDALRAGREAVVARIPAGAPLELISKIIDYSTTLVRATLLTEMSLLVSEIADEKNKNDDLTESLLNQQKFSINSDDKAVDVAILMRSISAAELESAKLARDGAEWRAKSSLLEVELLNVKAQLTVLAKDAEAKSSFEWKKRFDELARINYEARISDRMRIENLEIQLTAARAVNNTSVDNWKSKFEASEVQMNAYRRKVEALSAEAKRITYREKPTSVDSADGRSE